jgi:predicted phosphate transport protein (TIGR00153 family)
LFSKLFSQGKKERIVVEKIIDHIKLLLTACEDFREGFDSQNRNLIRDVLDLEREGDTTRREIIAAIYDGAFLPFFRPDLCRFVETVDRVFDAIEETANHYLEVTLPETIKAECSRVALLNVRICEMLLNSFEAMLKGAALREKMLAIRIYEKKIDDIKFDLLRQIRRIPVSNFWEGRILAEFVDGLTSISDIVEDAGDYLNIISVSMR